MSIENQSAVEKIASLTELAINKGVFKNEETLLSFINQNPDIIRQIIKINK